MTSRPAAVAGRFYPGEPRRLADTVDRLLSTVTATDLDAPPIGLVVPHAGYRYSGPVAASAYALLARARQPVERVVLLGPAHFLPLDGCAVPTADEFLTPLGPVPIDQQGCARLAGRGDVVRADEPHAAEHSIEVQLPFLQRVLPTGWSLLPVLVGHAAAGAVADVVTREATPDSVVICSTDLSHYLDQAQAAERDRRTAAAILARDPEAVGDHDACGARPLRGLLTWARRRDVDVELLDLRTSGDTAGHPSRVVGYGAFALVDRAPLGQMGR